VEKSLLEISADHPDLIMTITTSPRHHHPIFVCLPISRGPELPETLRAQIVILKMRDDSWADIGALLGVHPEE
jgi:hypothetical protein